MTSFISPYTEDRNKIRKRFRIFLLLFLLTASLFFFHPSLISFFTLPPPTPLYFHSNLFPSRHEDAGLKFIEVFVNTPLSECEKRDPKGLYKKARAGEIPQFTGISAPYEAPENAEIVLLPAEKSVDECCEQVLEYLVAQGLVKKD